MVCMFRVDVYGQTYYCFYNVIRNNRKVRLSWEPSGRCRKGKSSSPQGSGRNSASSRGPKCRSWSTAGSSVSSPRWMILFARPAVPFPPSPPSGIGFSWIGRFDDGDKDRAFRRKEWRRILGKTGRGKASFKATSAKGRSNIGSQGSWRKWKGDDGKYPFGLPVINRGH